MLIANQYSILYDGVFVFVVQSLRAEIGISNVDVFPHLLPVSNRKPNQAVPFVKTYAQTR